MNLPASDLPLSWDDIRLVVFDVDGTLYQQRPVRLRMALDAATHAVSSRTLSVMRVLRDYRRIRERLGDAETADFETQLLAQTSVATGVAPETVRAIVGEWMERRPLSYLRASRYRGVESLFEGLRKSGRIVGVLSDYPAHDKLMALNLSAHHIVSATDEHVGVLKPNPQGLLSVINSAGVTPAQTVMIGDRQDRDGMAARRAGTYALIRSSRPIEGWHTFRRFDEALFAPFLGG